jgi:uncharacterized membrane protein YfcA
VVFSAAMKSFLTSLLIGLAAGVFGGLVGLGGGVVMIPLMVGLAGLRQHEAHGTSLVALVFTGAMGAATYATRGAVDVAAAVSLAVPAVLTARLGARYAHSLPEWQLKRAFGAFLVLVTALLLLKPHLSGLAVPAGGASKVVVLVAAGVFTGFLSGMMGVGGGSLMVPAMVLLAGFPQVLAQGSSLLAMIPAGAAGAHKHWQLGNVVRRLLPGLVPGIVVGTWLGSSAAVRLDEGSLRAAFAIVVAYSGVRMIRTPRPAPVPAPGLGGA